MSKDIQVNTAVCGLLQVRWTDREIARAVAWALARDTRIPTGRVSATVLCGRVQLKGVLAWHYQRNAARAAVRSVHGVTGIDDAIRMAPVSCRCDR